MPCIEQGWLRVSTLVYVEKAHSVVMSHGNINKPHPFQLTNIELMNYEFHLGIIGCVVTCIDYACSLYGVSQLYCTWLCVTTTACMVISIFI